MESTSKQQSGPQDDPSAQEWLVFEVAGERYCQAVSPVKEVLLYEPPVPVPGAPGYICGITNVRGEVLTVLSAPELLEVKAQPVNEQTRVITFELGGSHYGLLVDGVSEILRLREEDLDYSGQSGPDRGDNLLRGTFSTDEGLIIAVDVAGFIQQQLDSPS